MLWTSQDPHEHNSGSIQFPGAGTEDGAGNYCRNPGNEFDTIWCYTTDPEIRYEECVPLCDNQLV